VEKRIGWMFDGGMARGEIDAGVPRLHP